MSSEGHPSDTDQDGKVVKVVGNYLVGPTIGSGYFARVKRVEDPYRQVYAMKCFDKSRITRNPHTLKQVEKEINALRLCSHPSIAKFHEVLEVENSVYLIMEYIPDGELFDYIKQKGRLSEPEAVYMGKQIISALDYCHKNGIAHRDVKPENILIDDNGNVKLVDFGLCSFYRQSPTPSSGPLYDDVDSSQHGHGAASQNVILHTQCGSPHYAAPEVLLGLGYDGPAADIWSFGVLLYAMVTGSLPFTARLIPQLVQRIVAGVYRMPAHLSPLCKHLLSSILRVNPRDRHSIDEIIKHPWWSRTEKWVPPVHTHPDPSKQQKQQMTEAMILGALQREARQQYLVAHKLDQSEESKVCSSCGKSLRPRIDSQGMIVLSLPSSSSPSPEDDASSQQNDTTEDLCQCNKGKTPLPSSTEHDDAPEAAALMQMPKFFNNDDQLDDHQSQVLQTVNAVSSTHIDTLKQSAALFEQAVADVKTSSLSNRENDLLMAADTGDVKAVQAIIARVCPKLEEQVREQATVAGTTPDFSSIPPGACVCPDHRHRLDLRVGGLDNWTALHYAARSGYVSIADTLIQSLLPLDINATTKNHWTPLMFAADRGHAAVVDLLLNYRADIHCTSKDDKTAIFLARERNFTDISQRLTQASSVRYMRSLQSNTGERLIDRLELQTELFDACERGDLNKVQTLWPLSLQNHPVDPDEAKVDFLGRGPDNWTLLHYAARRGRYNEVLYILGQLTRSIGPTNTLKLINSPTKTGWTPLMMAAYRKHIKLSNLLIDAGADLDITSREGENIDNLLQSSDPDHKTILAHVTQARKSRQAQMWK